MRVVLTSLTVLILLPACSTVAGVGKDVSAVGRGLTHVADEVRDEVFRRGEPDRYVEWRDYYHGAVGSTVIVKEPCDPAADELRGGSGLPPCPRVDYRQ